MSSLSATRTACHLPVAEGCDVMQRRAQLRVDYERIGAVVEKQPDDVRVAGARGMMQRRRAIHCERSVYDASIGREPHAQCRHVGIGRRGRDARMKYPLVAIAVTGAAATLHIE